MEDLIRRQALRADHHVRPPKSDAGTIVVAPTMRAHEVEDWKQGRGWAKAKATTSDNTYTGKGGSKRD